MLTRRTVSRTHQLVGPREDPYSRESWEVLTVENGRQNSVVLTSCALAMGVQLEVNERIVVPFPRVENEEDVDALTSALVGFECLTGIDTRRLEKLYYQRLCYEDPMGSPRSYE